MSPPTRPARATTILWVAGVVLAACRGPATPPNVAPTFDPQAAWDMVAERGPEPGGNVIVILLDDAGVDKIAAYGVHPDPAYTPVMDALILESVLFRTAWAEPTCSPTRAAALTGRNPDQTGVGRWIHSVVNPVRLSQDETTLAELLSDADTPYTSAVAGKWHLTEWSDGENPARDALDQGFERHRGSMANPEMTFSGSVQGGGTYFNWEKNTDGELAWSDTYMTTDTANEAVAFLDEVDTPFFLWLALNAPHLPMHRPPDALLSQPPPANATDAQLYSSVLEAADTEIGRVLDSMSEEQRQTTTIILVGDNGTASAVMTGPSDPERSKDTVFDGGVRVPLFVSGPYVTSPGESSAMVQTTDIFATVAQIAGIDVHGARGLDSVSFLPQVVDPTWPAARGHLFAEEFRNSDAEWSVRNDAYKLIQRKTGDVLESFHRYAPDPFDEGVNLLETDLSPEEEAVLDTLRDQLDDQRRWMRKNQSPLRPRELD